MTLLSTPARRGARAPSIPRRSPWTRRRGPRPPRGAADRAPKPTGARESPARPWGRPRGARGRPEAKGRRRPPSSSRERASSRDAARERLLELGLDGRDGPFERALARLLPARGNHPRPLFGVREKREGGGFPRIR